MSQNHHRDLFSVSRRKACGGWSWQIASSAEEVDNQGSKEILLV